MSDVSVNSNTTPDLQDTFGETLVLSRIFEQVLKRPEDDEAENSALSSNSQVDKTVAFAIAQGITGFGE